MKKERALMDKRQNPPRSTRLKLELEIPEGADHRFVMFILKVGTAAGVVAFVWFEVSKLFR
jgi:hypothetical protein